MPAHERFEDHPVWRTAAELYDRTDDFITQAIPRVRNPLLEQLERAALDITNSIATGCKRTSLTEQRACLHRARDSADEMRSMLLLVAHRPHLTDFRTEIANLIRLTESCSRQLRAWSESPNDPALAGARARHRRPGRPSTMEAILASRPP